MRESDLEVGVYMAGGLGLCPKVLERALEDLHRRLESDVSKPADPKAGFPLLPSTTQRVPSKRLPFGCHVLK